DFDRGDTASLPTPLQPSTQSGAQQLTTPRPPGRHIQAERAAISRLLARNVKRDLAHPENREIAGVLERARPSEGSLLRSRRWDRSCARTRRTLCGLGQSCAASICGRCGGNLLHSVKTGESARKLVGRRDCFDDLAHDEQAALVFNRAMAELTSLVTN